MLGGALLDLLLAEGHEVRSLVREGSPRAACLNLSRTSLVRGDASEARDLLRALSGMDALVHVAGIEHTPTLLEAMRRTKVRRLVVVGTTSVHSTYEFRSEPKLGMERLVRESGLD